MACTPCTNVSYKFPNPGVDNILTDAVIALNHPGATTRPGVAQVPQICYSWHLKVESDRRGANSRLKSGLEFGADPIKTNSCIRQPNYRYRPWRTSANSGGYPRILAQGIVKDA